MPGTGDYGIIALGMAVAVFCCAAMFCFMPGIGFASFLLTVFVSLLKLPGNIIKGKRNAY